MRTVVAVVLALGLCVAAAGPGAPQEHPKHDRVNGVLKDGASFLFGIGVEEKRVGGFCFHGFALVVHLPVARPMPRWVN